MRQLQLLESQEKGLGIKLLQCSEHLIKEPRGYAHYLYIFDELASLFMSLLRSLSDIKEGISDDVKAVVWFS